MNRHPCFPSPHTRALSLVLALAAPFALLADSVDWTAYEQSFEVSFSGYVGSSTLQNFPALVHISPRLNGFDYSKCKVPGGGDLRFSDEEGNLLDSEVDTWNPNGESLVWVKVPQLNRDTKITAHYGCYSPAAVTPANVWSEGYVGVWHLNESALPLKESSGVSTDFSASYNSTETLGAAGAIGGAVDFSSGDNAARLCAADDDDLDGFTDCTFEVWTKQDAAPSRTSGILAKRKSSSEDFAYFIYNNYSTEANKHGRNIFMITTNGSSVDYPLGSTHNMVPAWGEWCHQAFVRDVSGTGKAYGYVNGNKKTGAGQSGSIHASAEPLYLGNSNGGVATFNGMIDEVRISNVARSADWLQASHDTVAKADFAAYSTEKNDWGVYSHKFTVAFTNAFSDATTLQNFPVLVRVSTNGIPGFLYTDCLVENGGDLRFADENDILLQSEIDTWNTNGESLVWVKVPSLSSETKLTAYYGCALPGEVTPSEVWSEGYVGVWHLGESALPMVESSGVSTGFTSAGGSGIGYAVAGAVGGAVDFSGGNTSARLSADDDDDLDGFTDCTFEVWTKQEAAPTTVSYAYILAKRTKNAEDVAYILYNNKSSDAAKNGRNVFGISVTGTSTTYLVGTGHNMEPTWGEWCHQAFVRDTTANKGYGYLNGTQIIGGNAGSGALFDSTSKLHLGNAQGNGCTFNGLIDELRISRVARSAAWIKASHDTVTVDNFASCGPVKDNARGLFIYFR